MARVMLIGVELVDSLTLRYLTPLLKKSGHSTKLISFGSISLMPSILNSVASFKPDLIGLSMIFNLRAKDFCTLASSIRKNGFKGHITAGGFFAHFNARSLLRDCPEIDSITYGEGEYTLADLADNLSSPEIVAGLCIRRKKNSIIDTAPRDLITNLDVLPFPDHQLPPRAYLGVRECNVMSSRGCYANCSFCSIQAWIRNTGLSKLRKRSPANVADEMAELYHQHHVRVFYFTDDNFLVPDPKQNLKRLQDLKNEIQKRNIKDIAIAMKCRPDCVDPEVFKVLTEMGLIRVFLGIESYSQKGLNFLGRNMSVETNIGALETLLNLDIHVTYNILMFNPDSTMDEVLQNIDVLERFSNVPMNFCRTEVYQCTPLEDYLRKTNRLLGNYFNYDYVIADSIVEAVFKSFAIAFDKRNFGERRINELAMQIDYGVKIMKRFKPAYVNQELERKADAYIRKLNMNTISYLRSISEYILKSWPLNEKELAEISYNIQKLVEKDNKKLWDEGQRFWRKMEHLSSKDVKSQVGARNLFKYNLVKQWRFVEKCMYRLVFSFSDILAPLTIFKIHTSVSTSGLFYMSDYAPRWPSSERKYGSPPPEPPSWQKIFFVILIVLIGVGFVVWLAYT